MKDLFSEFGPLSAQQWKEKIVRDLKGEPFESLIWHNDNGFDVMPFYTGSDAETDYKPAFSHTSWALCVDAGENDTANKKLLRQLERGANAIYADLSFHQPATLLSGIRLELIHATFVCNNVKLKELTSYIATSYEGKNLQLTLFPDRSQVNDEETVAWLREATTLEKYGARIAGVDALPFINSGALPRYELALTFAALAEKLELCEKGKMPPSQQIAVRTATDSDLFMQIAKMRAFRRLWEVLKAEFGLKNGLYIVAETALTNKSYSGKYNNLLRSTIECTAAIAGGCNELLVHSFDAFSDHSRTGERLALNQQLILKEESYFDKMADVSCGSYYIEKLTDTLATAALEDFKDIMTSGGFTKLWNNGTIQKLLDTQYDQKSERIRAEKTTVVGVNRYTDKDGAAATADMPAAPFVGKEIRNPVIAFEMENNFRKT